MSADNALVYDGLLEDAADKRDYNRRLFRVVAPSYQTVTRVLSWGRDRAWKQALVNSLPPLDRGVILDLACGTGDITFLEAQRFPRARTVGLDLCTDMLRVASSHRGNSGVTLTMQDMARLGIRDRSADLVTGGYALRNAPDLGAALTEIYRVLKPGATASFLDFSKPAAKYLQRLELLILRFWGGFWGWVFHRNPRVYTYIAATLELFPDRVQFRTILRGLGFVDVRTRLLFFGFAELVTFRRPGVESDAAGKDGSSGSANPL